MLLIYQNKNNKTYSYINQSYPSHITEIGTLNKRGQLLVVAYFITQGKTFVLSSWEDYYTIVNKLYRPNVFDRYNQLKKSFKLSLSCKLERLAWKLRR